MQHSTPLGDRIRTVRGSLNQGDFAKAIGINRNSLRAYEKGRAQPNAQTIATMCSVFCVNPFWLLLGEDPIFMDDRKECSIPETSTSEPFPPDNWEDWRNEHKELRKENTELRAENRELRQENRELLKQNADLRVELAEMKARAAPDKGSNEVLAGESARKIA